RRNERVHQPLERAHLAAEALGDLLAPGVLGAQQLHHHASGTLDVVGEERLAEGAGAELADEAEPPRDHSLRIDVLWHVASPRPRARSARGQVHPKGKAKLLHAATPRNGATAC